jgi:hypothetical protein
MGAVGGPSGGGGPYREACRPPKAARRAEWRAFIAVVLVPLAMLVVIISMGVAYWPEVRSRQEVLDERCGRMCERYDAVEAEARWESSCDCVLADGCVVRESPVGITRYCP